MMKIGLFSLLCGARGSGWFFMNIGMDIQHFHEHSM